MTHPMGEHAKINRSSDHALAWAWPALAVMLAGEKGVDLGSGLVVVGLALMAAGLLWAGRATVAPMLAIAAAALALPGDPASPGMGPTAIVTACAAAGALIALAGAFRVSGVIVWALGRGPIDGLRLALGLWLAGRGAQWVLQSNLVYGPDSWLTAGLAALLAIASWRLRRAWPVGALLVIGAMLAWWKDPYVSGHVALSWSLPRWTAPTWPEARATLGPLAIPQALLTLAALYAAVNPLASAASVEGDESRKDTPSFDPVAQAREQERVASAPDRRLLAAFGGAIALAAGCIGAMPLQLGDTVSHRRRHPEMVERLTALVIGVLLLIAGLVVAPSLMNWCAAMPGSIMGVLAAIIGIQLALPVLDGSTWRSSTSAMLTAAVALATGHLGWAMLLGWVTSIVIGAGMARKAGATGSRL